MAKKPKVEVIDKNKGGLDLGLILELVGVVVNSTRNREGDKAGGIGIDTKKLAWGVAGIAGQQALKGAGQWRKQRQLQKELKGGLIDLDDFKDGRLAADKKADKKGGLGPGVLAGSAIGGALYLLSMSPEDRTRFFKQLDGAISQVAGLVNELQGKPYTPDYEAKKAE